MGKTGGKFNAGVYLPRTKSGNLKDGRLEQNRGELITKKKAAPNLSQSGAAIGDGDLRPQLYVFFEISCAGKLPHIATDFWNLAHRKARYLMSRLPRVAGEKPTDRGFAPGRIFTAGQFHADGRDGFVIDSQLGHNLLV